MIGEHRNLKREYQGANRQIAITAMTVENMHTKSLTLDIVS